MELKDLIALFALLVTIVSVMFTLRHAGLSSKSKVLFDVFTEFRSQKFTEVRALAKAATATTPVNFEAFREYSYFLNHIGLLLHKGYVSTEEIYQMAGLSIIASWQLLRPHILLVRHEARLAPKEANRTPYYQFHFEYLAAQLLDYSEKGNKTIERLMAESAEKISRHSSVTK